MKVVVTSEGPDLDSKLDPRFGRCAYFVVVDTETMEVKAVPNEARGAMGGAGIKAAQMVDELGVKAVLTGNVGPNAYDTLGAAGIEIFINMTGTVKDAVERYKGGQAEKASAATNPPMHGGGGGRGMGRGQGGGGGGRGPGRGNR